jgi:hypothetical protein
MMMIVLDKTLLLHGREKVKIGDVLIKCVVFNTSCVANFPSEAAGVAEYIVLAEAVAQVDIDLVGP